MCMRIADKLTSNLLCEQKINAKQKKKKKGKKKASTSLRLLRS